MPLVPVHLSNYLKLKVKKGYCYKSWINYANTTAVLIFRGNHACFTGVKYIIRI